jgi:predicted transcriptional regulator
VKLNIYILKILLLIGEHVRGLLRGLFIAAVIAACAIGASYVVLNHFYGISNTRVIWEGVAPVTWGTAEQLKPDILTWENTEQVGTTFSIVENVGWYTYAGSISWENAEQYNSVILVYDNMTDAMSTIRWENADQLKLSVIATNATGYRDNSMSKPLPEQQAGGAGVNLPFVISETKPINVFPISAIIGISMGFMVFSVWIGYKRMWGDAASTLLEQGLHDMTVRDVEIVGQIIDLEEFTIPELVRRTGASKITVWRTVQKLIEQGLVKQIEQTKPAANGLGGRGKPSRVYKYVGAPSSETSTK